MPRSVISGGTIRGRGWKEKGIVTLVYTGTSFGQWFLNRPTDRPSAALSARDFDRANGTRSRVSLSREEEEEEEDREGIPGHGDHIREGGKAGVHPEPGLRESFSNSKTLNLGA